MHAVGRNHRFTVYGALAAVALLTGAALIFGYLYRPDNEDLSRAGSFAGVIGATLGVLIAVYAIYIEWHRAEFRHEEANAAWAAAVRLRHAIASLDWMLPDAGQNAWIIASACRPRYPNSARVVRELGSAGLPGSDGDSYLAGLEELHDSLSAAISTGIGRVLGVAWDSELWEAPGRTADDYDESRGVLAVRPLLELKAATHLLIDQRRRGLMALPDAFTLAQLQAIFRALSHSEDGDEGETPRFKGSQPGAPNLTVMHDFRDAYEDDDFDSLAEDTYLGFYLDEYAAWMGPLLPYVGIALPLGRHDHGGPARWAPLGESDRPKLASLRPTISAFFAWRPDRPFDLPQGNDGPAAATRSRASELVPDVWVAASLAAQLQAASNAGNPEATNSLGVLYACTKPINQAYSPLDEAAQAGSTNAMANLGVIHYEMTHGIEPKDSPERLQAWHNATAWFMRVQENDPDHPMTLMFGGLLAYEAGHQDDAEEYFTSAHDRGVLAASGALMTLAASRGDGVEAIKWRDAQAATLDSLRADDPLEVLARLNGYSLNLARALS